MQTMTLSLLAAMTSLLSLVFPYDAHSAEGRGKVILILDASGSMWGRIEEKEKILIAREVFVDILTDWDENIDLGVVAYGHRRKGDCTDIETVVPVGPPDTAAIRTTVDALMPKGKTPLTASVVLAARELKYVEDRATVILISDGKETCDMDPCSVGAELEASGVDFTAHVIGFDIDEEARSGLRCLADATGGRYFDAQRADELRAALQVVVEEIEADPDTVITSLTAGGPAFSNPHLTWTFKNAAGDEANQRGASLILPAEAGAYDITVTFNGIQKQTRIEVIEGKTQQHIVVLDVGRLQLKATAASPEGPIDDPQVAWSIADQSGRKPFDDFQDSERSVFLRSDIYTIAAHYEGETLTQSLQLNPGAEQTIEIHFNIKLASIQAPEQAAMGSAVDVTWSGPDGRNDYIAVTPPDTADNAHINYTYTRTGSPASVLMPDTPGDYEIRYLTGQSRHALARRSIEVVAVEEYTRRLASEAPATLTLEAVDASSGSPIADDLSWTVYGIDGYNKSPVNSQEPRPKLTLPMGIYRANVSRAGASESLELIVDTGADEVHTLKLKLPGG